MGGVELGSDGGAVQLGVLLHEESALQSSMDGIHARRHSNRLLVGLDERAREGRVGLGLPARDTVPFWERGRVRPYRRPQRSLLYIMSIWELEEERTEATKVTRCASLLAIAQVIEVSTASGSTGE